MPGPLAGTLNALNAPPQLPEQRGLVIPTAPPSSPRQPPQREMGLGEILGKLGGMAAQTTQIPRMMAWNLGPALVGRSGEGPQTGAEALQGLGLNYDSPWQRALGHGGGKALDLLADPMNLIGMGRGAPRAAAAEGGGNLIRRLEQHAGPGLADSLAANPATATIPQLEWGTRSVPNAPFSPRSPFMPRVPLANVERAVPTGIPSGGGPMPRADFDALRAQQLNSTSFNPALSAPDLGTSAFSQGSPAAPSLTRRLEQLAVMPPARTPLSGPNLGPPTINPTAVPGGTPLARPLTSMPPPYFNEARASGQTISPNRQGTLADVLATAELPRTPAAPPNFGPPVPPAPATSGTPAPFVTGANQPIELGGLNLRAAFEAVRSGRGRTLPLGRGDTLPNGPIDY